MFVTHLVYPDAKASLTWPNYQAVISTLRQEIDNWKSKNYSIFLFVGPARRRALEEEAVHLLYLGEEEVSVSFSRGGTKKEEFVLWPGFEPPGCAPEWEEAVSNLDKKGVVPWLGVEPLGCAPEGEGLSHTWIKKELFPDQG
jgi:hypothetical protein